MQHKGYDVELVAVNFEVWEGGERGEARCVDRLKTQLEKPNSLLITTDVLEGGIKDTPPLPFVAKSGNLWPMVEATEPFAVYDFTVVPLLPCAILQEQVEEHGVCDTIGPDTYFWPRVLECREKVQSLMDNCPIGTVVTVWAVNEHTCYVECGDGDVCGEAEYDWELVGFIGPDMQVVEVGFGWPPKTDAYDYYVAQERTADPDFGLQIYLCGFDYQTAFDEVSQ